jgi:gas vesicle protein
MSPEQITALGTALGVVIGAVAALLINKAKNGKK